MTAMRRAHSGFSLIELLVSVGIIALLTAVLVPSLRGARDAAKATRCRANLRQWTIAVGLYAQEHCGFLPRRGQGVQAVRNVTRCEDWFNALPPLLSMPRFMDLAADDPLPKPGDTSLWMCPRAEPADGTYSFAYGMNMRLSTWDAPHPDRVDAVAPAALQVFLGEGVGSHCSILPAARAYTPIARHAGRTSIAFLDGHVQAFSEQYVGCGSEDPQRFDIQWLVPSSAWQPPP